MLPVDGSEACRRLSRPGRGIRVGLIDHQPEPCRVLFSPMHAEVVANCQAASTRYLNTN